METRGCLFWEAMPERDAEIRVLCWTPLPLLCLFISSEHSYLSSVVPVEMEAGEGSHAYAGEPATNLLALLSDGL